MKVLYKNHGREAVWINSVLVGDQIMIADLEFVTRHPDRQSLTVTGPHIYPDLWSFDGAIAAGMQVGYEMEHEQPESTMVPAGAIDGGLPVATIQKHTPGGVDHEQGLHGNWSDGSTDDQTTEQAADQLLAPPKVTPATSGLSWTPVPKGTKPLDKMMVHNVSDMRHLSDTESQQLQADTKRKSIIDVANRVRDNPDVIAFANSLRGQSEVIEGGQSKRNPAATDLYDTGRYPDDPIQGVVDGMIDSWASGSDEEIAMLNNAVAEEFGLVDSSTHGESLSPYWTPIAGGDGSIDPAVGMRAHRAVARAVYENTQEMLAPYPDEFVLFRGLMGENNSRWLDQRMDNWGALTEQRYLEDNPGKGFPGQIYGEVEITGSPIASWTSSYGVAKGDFSRQGMVLSAVIPKQAIFSTALTGHGSLIEDEIIVLDHGSNIATVFPNRQSKRSQATLDFETGGKPMVTSQTTRANKLWTTESFLNHYNNFGVWADADVDPSNDLGDEEWNQLGENIKDGLG